MTDQSDEGSTPRIRDIPTYAKLLDDARGLGAIKMLFPAAKPLLQLSGMDVKKLEESFAGFDELVEKTHELRSIPNRFNDKFASRGWIMYQMRSFEIAKEAVAAAAPETWIEQ